MVIYFNTNSQNIYCGLTHLLEFFSVKNNKLNLIASLFKQKKSLTILFFYFGKELREFLAEWAWTMPRSDHSREKGRKQGRKATSCDTKRRSSCRQKRREVNKEAKKAIKLIKDEKVVEQVRKAAVGKKRVWIRTWQKRTRKQGRLHMEKNGREPDSED